jgi:hypothetical protein
LKRNEEAEAKTRTQGNPAITATPAELKAADE